MAQLYDTETITAEYLRARHVVFYPADTREARYIQERLLGWGFPWANGDDMIKETGKCVSTGMTLSDEGRIFTGPSLEYDYVVKSACDFEGFTPQDLLGAEERTKARFNALSRRIGEVERKLDRILELLEPSQLKKMDFKGGSHGR